MEQYLITVIIALTTGFFGWFLTARKNMAQDRAAELDNAINAVKYYRELFEDVVKKLKEATETIKSMEIEQHNLIETNKNLVSELQKFKQLNGKNEHEKH